MHSLCFNQAKDRARVDVPQDRCLVHRNHFGLGTTCQAPTDDFPGTADEQRAFRLDGDLGSLFLHVSFVAFLCAVLLRHHLG